MKLGIGETIPFGSSLRKMILRLQPESHKNVYVPICGWNGIYILKPGNVYCQITSLLTELVCCYMVTSVHYQSYVYDVLKIWILLQFGDTEIGFCNGGGEGKKPMQHGRRTRNPSCEPIPFHCLRKRMDRGKWCMKSFGVCNTAPAALCWRPLGKGLTDVQHNWSAHA